MILPSGSAISPASNHIEVDEILQRRCFPADGGGRRTRRPSCGSAHGRHLLRQTKYGNPSPYRGLRKLSSPPAPEHRGARWRRRPSQLLYRMRQLQGDRPPEGHNILRELFIQRLPPNISMILAFTGAVTLDTLADIADKVAECATPTISTVGDLVTATPTFNNHFNNYLRPSTSFSCRANVLGGELVAPHRDAAHRHTHVLRHRNLVSLLPTARRCCADTIAHRRLATLASPSAACFSSQTAPAASASSSTRERRLAFSLLLPLVVDTSNLSSLYTLRTVSTSTLLGGAHSRWSSGFDRPYGGFLRLVLCSIPYYDQIFSFF